MVTFPRAAAVGLLVLAGTAVAADWPQWRGPHRNGVSSEKDWLDGWPQDKAPRVAWRAAVGRGHSAVSVRGGRAYTMGWDGKQDTVFCLDADTGAVRWKQSYPCAGIHQWPGPRATPTVDGEAVYTLSQHGLLNAFAAADGRKRWSVQLPGSYNPDVDYGFAWSPLVEGDLLILGAGSRGLALDKRTGKYAWGNDGRHGACASAVPFTLGGVRGVAVITVDPGRDSASLVGVEAATGKVLWRHGGWPEKWGAACTDLLVHDGKVFVTTAEQYHRCARFTIDGGRLKPDWSSAKMKSYTGGCVLVGGHVYGVSTPGILKCLDWETGAEKWGQRGFGNHGALTTADNKLLVQTSDGGELVVVEAAPGAYRELRRATVFAREENTFTAPVLANGRVYCRSYAGEVVCLDLRKRRD